MENMDNFRERFEALEQQTKAMRKRTRTAGRVAILEGKLAAMAFDAAANEVVITGANLRIVNGLGTTDTANGLGNLIVGYNEPRGFQPEVRTGSHNVSANAALRAARR
jgi:hypothetical protein